MKGYKKYKWFYTSSGKLVLGGKNAEQNDELLNKMKKLGKERIVMHTSHPGSPFCVIISDVVKVSKNDLAECAIFTGCFSRAWKLGRKSTRVHMFMLSQVNKEKGMKTGTWGVKERVRNVKVNMELFLIKQKRVYRAVPFSVKGGIRVCPGRVDKTKMVDKLRGALGDEKAKADELLSALPAGGVRIC
jgi:hypothetical protein